MIEDIRKSFDSDVVKRSDVYYNLSPEHANYLASNCSRVKRGYYFIGKNDESSSEPVISNAATEVLVEPEATNDVQINSQQEEKMKGISVNSIIDAESLIPESDPHYVRHGCYRAVSQVIKSDIFAPVYITGESGNGKTLGVEQACAVAKRELVAINITNETSEEDLIGNYILEGGNMVWRSGPVEIAMERGSVLLLDELDQARPDILAIQTILQGKPYFNKKTGRLISPKSGFQVIATSNTKGQGSGMDRFVGAQILNEAFLERFPIFIEQGYPSPAVETRILKHYTDDTQFIERLTRFARITRNAAKQGGLEEGNAISTRRLVQIAQNNNIFNNEEQAMEFALNRFEDDIRDSFIELYTKIQNDPEYESSTDVEEDEDF